MLPILEYSAVVWDNCTIQDSNALENFQNEAASIVTGLTRSISFVNLYKECDWVTLNTRRKEQNLAFMYKAVIDLTPGHISDLILHFVRDTTSYPRTPDYTLFPGAHVCWSEHSDLSFVYGFMSLDYGLGTMTTTTSQ